MKKQNTKETLEEIKDFIKDYENEEQFDIDSLTDYASYSISYLSDLINIIEREQNGR